MNKHYILSINPQAQHEWDRRVIRNPLTGARPDLLEAIAEAVGDRAGNYLISVNIDVQILEQTNPIVETPVELPRERTIAKTKQSLLAS